MLGTPVSSQDGSRRLNCLIEGESIVFSVPIKRDCVVSDLKEEIKMKRALGPLKDVDPHTLELWKVNIDLKPHDEDSISHLKLEEIGEGAEKLTSWKLFGQYWSDQPSLTHLHIIVKAPATREGLDSIYKTSKKPRRSDESEFDGTPDLNLAGLYQLFWGIVNSGCFQVSDVKIPDIRTLSVEDKSSMIFTTITLPDGIVFPFGSQSFLVTRVYEKFWKLITEDEEKWQNPKGRQNNSRFAESSHATIIKGQPGIGKTVFLSYALVRRLQAKLPTVYCDGTEYVHIFTESEVTKVKMTPGSRISELETNPQCCALVNIGPMVQEPPFQFFPGTRRGTVVVATSPNPGHVMDFSKEWPGISYCMPTWNWEELYFASSLWLSGPAEQNHSESLRDVFTNYRGISRICLFLFSQNGMKGYESNVQAAIRNIPSIEGLIASVKGPLPFKDSTSHRLVTIEPTLQSWEETSTEITSPHIVRLLFKKIQQYEMHQVSQSIKNLLAHPDSRGPGGVLFEQAVHLVFCKGITFTAEGISTKAPHLEVSIDAKDQEYSYFYHLRNTRAAKGSQDIGLSYLNRYMIPNLKNKESIDSVWLSKHCTVLFQMTVSKKHPLKSHGIRTLLKELPANAQKDVRIVFVLPLGDEETSSFRKQSITPEDGEAKKVTEEVQKYPQYVYRFDYVNRLSRM